MIDHYTAQVFKGLQVLKEDADYIEMAVDFANTEKIIDQIQYSKLMLLPDPVEQMRKLQVARKQNQCLGNKYPDIEEILLATKMLSKEQGRASSRLNAPETDEYKLLKQDCYGIIWHVLKKKGIVTRMRSI